MCEATYCMYLCRGVWGLAALVGQRSRRGGVGQRWYGVHGDGVDELGMGRAG